MNRAMWRSACGMSLEPLEQRGIFLVECAILTLGIFWAEFHQDAPWRGVGLAAALLIALWAWWRALAHASIIGGTPLANRIASTAQGYARLAGRGRLFNGPRVFEPGSGQPCLWYRVDSREDGSRQSDGSFLLDDDSGAVCAVDPEGAEMLVRPRYAANLGEGAYLQYWCLRPGDQIYVLGEFTTVGSIDPGLDTRRQTGELLERWKADRPELLRRFDLDGDGQLTEQEWERARAAARREVERAQQEALAAPEVHVMRKPRDGRPYLITDRAPDILARRFRLWAIVHGAVFIATAAALAWPYVHHGSGV